MDLAIGFTGTRRGLSYQQLKSLTQAMFSACEASGRVSCFHGGCVGADAQFHGLSMALGASIVVHPATVLPHLRDNYCNSHRVLVREPAPPLVRNKAIVWNSNLVIAAPLELSEQQRGGTWSTWRLAKRAGKMTLLILRDGNCWTGPHPGFGAQTEVDNDGEWLKRLRGQDQGRPDPLD